MYTQRTQQLHAASYSYFFACVGGHLGRDKTMKKSAVNFIGMV